MRLRQIATVARELDPVVDDLCDVLGIEVCFNDPGVGAFGLHNALMPIGDTLLEVVVPKEEGTTAERLMDRRGGDSGYMAIFQTQDIDAEKANLKDLGIRTVWEADYPEAKGIHLHPRDVGGAIVSLDVMDPPESWKWAGPGWRDHIKTDRVREITGVELQGPDPEAMAKRWAGALRSEVRQEGDTWIVPVDGGICRFVHDTDGRGEGLSGLIVDAADPDAIFAAARERILPHDETSVILSGTKFYIA